MHSTFEDALCYYYPMPYTSEYSMVILRLPHPYSLQTSIQVYGDGCRTVFQPDTSVLLATLIHLEAHQCYAAAWYLTVNRAVVSVLPSIFKESANHGFPFSFKYRFLSVLFPTQVEDDLGSVVEWCKYIHIDNIYTLNKCMSLIKEPPHSHTAD